MFWEQKFAYISCEIFEHNNTRRMADYYSKGCRHSGNYSDPCILELTFFIHQINVKITSGANTNNNDANNSGHLTDTCGELCV